MPQHASNVAEPGAPPVIGADDRVVLFDGVCRLCAAWARFLIRVDRNGRFRLATVQSPAGAAILRFHGLATDAYDTMVLVEGGQLYTRSDAFLQVMRGLPGPWPLLTGLRIVPRALRDWLYDRVARRRYALFGRYEHCLLPTPDHEARFLDARAG